MKMQRLLEIAAATLEEGQETLQETVDIYWCGDSADFLGNLIGAIPAAAGIADITATDREIGKIALRQIVPAGNGKNAQATLRQVAQSFLVRLERRNSLEDAPIKLRITDDCRAIAGVRFIYGTSSRTIKVDTHTNTVTATDEREEITLRINPTDGQRLTRHWAREWGVEFASHLAPSRENC